MSEYNFLKSLSDEQAKAMLNEYFEMLVCKNMAIEYEPLVYNLVIIGEREPLVKNRKFIRNDLNDGAHIISNLEQIGTSKFRFSIIDFEVFSEFNSFCDSKKLNLIHYGIMYQIFGEEYLSKLREYLNTRGQNCFYARTEYLDLLEYLEKNIDKVRNEFEREKFYEDFKVENKVKIEKSYSAIVESVRELFSDYSSKHSSSQVNNVDDGMDM